MDNENQAPEAINSGDEVIIEEEEVTTDEETVEAPEEKMYSAKEFRQVVARAKKAEEALKKNLPAKEVTNNTNNNSVTEETIERKILLSRGLSKELIEELAAVAKVRGKSLLETENDPIFVEIKKSKEAEVKTQRSTLGASKASGSIKAKKSFDSDGLTADEHKELWRDRMSQ